MNKCVYALGFFDGVHIGHGSLLTACRELADELGADAGVVTFSSHPDALVRGAAPGLINTLADRDRLLKEKYHMDTVLTLPFDREGMASYLGADRSALSRELSRMKREGSSTITRAVSAY